VVRCVVFAGLLRCLGARQNPGQCGGCGISVANSATVLVWPAPNGGAISSPFGMVEPDSGIESGGES